MIEIFYNYNNKVPWYVGICKLLTLLPSALTKLYPHESLAPIDESELILKLQQKNHSALVLLYDRYAAALYGVIHNIIKIEEISEEVLQDCFFKIWDKIHSYDPHKGRLFTWMLNIARNLSIDQLRSKEFSHRKKLQYWEDGLAVKLFNTYAEENIVNTTVFDLLQHLNKKEHLIVQLIFFEGYSHTEIAKEYHIPLGTVKTRLRSALIKLRKLLHTG